MGIIQFIEHFGDYATILITAVFGALPFTMDFDAKVRQLAYNVVLFRGHLPSTVGLLRTAWRDSFRLAVQYSGLVRHHTVRRFRRRFRCGSSSWWRTGLDRYDLGHKFGLTAAAVGMFSAIVGGVIFARWGSKKGRTNELPALDKLPEDMRTGIISLPSQRPSVGRATTSPSSIEPIALHVAALAGVGVLHLIKAPHYLDTKLMGSVSGASTDFLVAVGIASIVPAVMATYILPLIILFVVGLAFCLVLFFYVAPRVIEHGWFERAVFS
ncbi:hypothetical protein [Corynebacterium diphtheriae]|uniref:hypothetical protein n=1 Tax=Corynebacterium diphtheriae TaxID=1717 RepID=UPI001FCFD8B5|nr:hypothetical protein [Corynebacterium diphtheriae]